MGCSLRSVPWEGCCWGGCAAPAAGRASGRSCCCFRQASLLNMICMKRAQPSTFSQSDADSAFSLYTLLDASGIVVLEPGNFPSTHGHASKAQGHGVNAAGLLE